jgi:hypothetical protein
MFNFTTYLAELGEVEVDYTVTDPGMSPRYGEDPDPGHDLEIQIEAIRFNGFDCSFGSLALRHNGRWVPVEEYLLEQAHEYHARHGG